MTQVVQGRAIALEFAGQLGRGYALGDAAEDQDQLGDGPLRSLERTGGEKVEDPPAAVAAVVDDRAAMAAMDPDLIVRSAAGADQTLGMEPVEQDRVAGVGVQQFFDGKVHDDLVDSGQPWLNWWSSSMIRLRAAVNTPAPDGQHEPSFL